MVWGIIRKGRFALLSVGATVLLLEIASFSHGIGQPAIAQPTADKYLAANADTVHWGYFSQDLEPELVIDSGETVKVEPLTHHANDDASLTVTGDPGSVSVYEWTEDFKGVNRRGAGSIDPDVYTVGAIEPLRLVTIS